MGIEKGDVDQLGVRDNYRCCGSWLSSRFLLFEYGRVWVENNESRADLIKRQKVCIFKQQVYLEG